MNKWEYNFGVPLDKTIQDKLEMFTLVASEHPASSEYGFEKDTFTPDGYPVEPVSSIVYPALLYKTIGIPVPESLTLTEPLFRQKAALAALKWAEKVFAKNTLNWSFHGIYFSEQVHGANINFCFPVTSMLVDIENNVHHCAVLAFPESHHEEDSWKDGMIPQYAMMQAQLTLWCSQQYAANHSSSYFPVDSAILVRIAGNLAANNTVRVVNYDPRQAERILLRLARAVANCNLTGSGYHENLVVIPKKEWKEEKQQDLDNAYCIDSDTFYDVVQQYMAARSARKRLEEEQEQLKQQMDNIAIGLASQIGQNHGRGTMETAGTVYHVSHKARAINPAKVTADLVRQLAPQHVDAIRESVIPRGRITIEAL